MKLALHRYGNGEQTRMPLRIRWHMVAARYGTTPEAVRNWPADDFIDACAFLGVTGGPTA
jgi:hypothetical protein